MGLTELLSLGARHRLEALKEAHKWVSATLAVVFLPALLAIHLPVSLLLVGTEGEAFYAGVILAVAHVAFALVGLHLSPPVEEMQWLLLRAGV